MKDLKIVLKLSKFMSELNQQKTLAFMHLLSFNFIVVLISEGTSIKINKILFLTT